MKSYFIEYAKRLPNVSTLTVVMLSYKYLTFTRLLLGKLKSVEPGELWGMLWALYEKISVKTALCILKTLKGSLFSMKKN